MFRVINLNQISELYSESAEGRYQQIINKFVKEYGEKPAFIARAPGRVNIIGEHIDYQGYGVLPAAIQKDCLIAVKTTEQRVINLRHVESKYPPAKISVDPQEKDDFPNNYVKYVKAGYRAAVRHLKAEQLTGLQLLIQGNVPIASGVSSSSALVVCTALATLHANKVQTTKQSMIESCITCERQTGTASGGMDQSISVMGRLDSCLYIQFSPIRCKEVHLPKGARFIVMNTLVQSAKLQTAVYRYNKRVCECRLAVRILAKSLGVSSEVSSHWKILKELESWSKLSLNEVVRLVDSFLDRKDYTKEIIQDILGEKIEEILQDIPLSKEVIAANKNFRLYQAAKHVFQQAYRVIEFTNVCNSALNDDIKLKLLGNLMNESQTSCKELYECSCPQIDELTSLALKNGALGSRLTGAGWGGCTVTLIQEKNAKKFMETMIQAHYTKQNLKQKVFTFGIQNVVFESKPSEGACIILI